MDEKKRDSYTSQSSTPKVLLDVAEANREYARKVAEAEMARHALADAVVRAQTAGYGFRDIELATKSI